MKAKAEAALSFGLNVILCVGESLEVREQGGAVETVLGAARRLACPTSIDGEGRARDRLRADLGDRHRQDPDDARKSRKCMPRSAQRLASASATAGAQVRILYGGLGQSLNAAEIFAIADVDGALVGGASLKAADFMPIVAAARQPVEGRAPSPKSPPSLFQESPSCSHSC